MKKSFPFYRQYDQKDCGPTCLKMILKYYGKSVSSEYLNRIASISKSGVSLSGIADAAEELGLQTAVVSISFQVLKEDVTLPCIAYWRKKHFVVVHRIEKDIVYVADPAFGKLKYSKEKFCSGWVNSEDNKEGIIMLIEPSTEFYNISGPVERKSKGLYFLIPYLKKYKRSWGLIVLALCLISLIQIAFPFLTQSIVDIGITTNDIDFIYLVLIAQLMLILSQTSIQIIRDWLLLFTTSKINIQLISDYLIKLMRLPLSYYESKNVGDIIQRIQDNNRVQNFLSSTSLNVLFSGLTFIIFSIVLLYYSFLIFLVFFSASILYFIWSILFLKKRAEIDYMRFDQASGNQTSLIQLINGMSEIRINGSERKRRWQWEGIQIKLFRISMKSLALSQTQNTGGVFINEIKNIVITVLSAQLVLSGEITLGMMLSIQYIIGQLNVPVASFVTFIQSAQDAKLSIKRLEEVYGVDDEEDRSHIKDIPEFQDIMIDNISFRYGAKKDPYVLEDISFKIPDGKITALVGVSGSGKTTILKLLLKFYDPQRGKITLGNTNFKNLSAKNWRKNCGVVMQDGFIFSGSIAENIAEAEEFARLDLNQVKYAAKIANIHEFIESLPNNYETGIGRSGMGLSGGQKQRILIARAVYKNPHYIFLDEATSALDARNELEIMKNLNRYVKGKSVLVIAHRLSTVKNAHNIIVLDKGKVVEEGTHDELTMKKGYYYNLVKNQLELGN